MDAIEVQAERSYLWSLEKVRSNLTGKHMEYLCWKLFCVWVVRSLTMAALLFPRSTRVQIEDAAIATRLFNLVG